ncbi:MAG TPA: chloride channel protein [Bdellovibrionota bacterium]|jgi:H+/Cl- antiporter ClcA|nr:chloride channel protein [Bdellovibrionota bacterium]
MYGSKNARHDAFYILVFVAMAVGVGAIAVGYARIFEIFERGAKDILRLHPGAFLVSCPVFFWLGAAIVRRFEPEARGSGPYHIVKALQALEAEGGENLAEARKHLSTRTSLVTMLSSWLGALGGMSLGREAPTVQITAGFAASVGLKCRRWLPNVDLHSWIVAGAAGGLAAAFNTPLGGVAFALEELSKVHLNRLRPYIFTSIIIAGLTAKVLQGPYFSFAIGRLVDPSLATVLPAALMGVFCGALATLLFLVWRFLSRLERRLDNFSRNLWPIVAGLCVGLIGYHYGPRTFGGGVRFLEYVFTEPGAAHLGLAEVVGRFFGTIFSASSGIAGGTLAPMLAVGSGLGTLVEHTGIFGPLAPHLLAILGMTAFLSATLSAPLTAVILVQEITDQPNLVIPLFAAALSAALAHKLITDLFKQNQ